MTDRRRLSRWRAVALAVAVGFTVGSSPEALGAPAVHAEDPILACLSTPADRIEYPKGLAEQKVQAVFRVSLRFVAPDRPPTMTVLYATGGGDFRTAVEDHVGRYRIPCLAPGAPPVELTQEFHFEAGDGQKVFWFPARNVDPKDAVSCVIGPDRWEGRSVGRGVVLARMRFTAPNLSPEVDILYEGAQRGSLASSVRDHVANYRMPCLRPGDGPITATQVFRFEMDGESRVTFRDVTRAEFVRGLDTLEQVRFDLTTMGCPFQVELRLYRPYLPNSVGEVGTRDTSRIEFLAWLQRADLRMAPSQRNVLLGQSTRISVPCGVLDLL